MQWFCHDLAITRVVPWVSTSMPTLEWHPRGCVLCFFHAEVHMGRVQQIQPIQLSHTLTLIPRKEHLRTLKDRSESADLLKFKVVSLRYILECIVPGMLQNLCQNLVLIGSVVLKSCCFEISRL